MTSEPGHSHHGASRPRRPLPRSFKDLTPGRHFNPRSFFREMIWKAWLTRRTGAHRPPAFPRLREGQVAITWIGHASFLVQFTDLNVLVDPNFANWLFLIKRIKRAGLKLKDLPPIDLVLLTHAHFDHFHKPSLRRLPHPKIGVMPWGMGDLARGLGFSRLIELQWWESFEHGDWRVTLTPCKHWGARMLHDAHRGYGGFVLEHQGRRIYHAGDSAYFEGFKEIGKKLRPEIALLPIGAYFPESFRNVHMGPDDAVKVFRDLRADWLVPMHYGSFKLSFEELDEPPRWLRELAHKSGLSQHVRFLEEITRQFNLWPLTAQVVCIAMLNAESQRGQVLFQAEDFEDDAAGGPVEYVPCADESELLTAFWDAARHYTHIVTFNGRGFDVPFLYLRSAVLGVNITRRDWLGYRYATEPHCDLADQFTFYGVSGRDGAARKFNLDFYCKAFGIESPKSHGITGMDVTDLLNAGRHREIADYCLRDVHATVLLHKIWKERLAGVK